MYLTSEELIAAFSHNILIQLSNDNPRATEIALNVVELAIVSACERIDAALRSRYTLPLKQTPTVLKQHCLYLARYFLYSRRPETKIPDNVKETYQQAIRELEQIALGKLHLGIDMAKAAESAVENDNDLLKDRGEFYVKARQPLDLKGY